MLPWRNLRRGACFLLRSCMIGSSVLIVLETEPDLTTQTSVRLRHWPALKKVACDEILRARLAAPTASPGSRLSTKKVCTALSGAEMMSEREGEEAAR